MFKAWIFVILFCCGAEVADKVKERCEISFTSEMVITFVAWPVYFITPEKNCPKPIDLF